MPTYTPPPSAPPAAPAPYVAAPAQAEYAGGYPAQIPVNPPPRTSRKGLWIAIVLIVLALLVAAVIAAVLLLRGARTIDDQNLETKISAELTRQAGTTVTVSCPSGQPAKAGTTFECTASADGQTRQVAITVNDDQGNVTWELVN